MAYDDQRVRTLPRYPRISANALGMAHTTYTDPSGFDPGTVSTAADQLRDFRRAMRFPAFRRIVSMASVTLPVAGTVESFDPLIDQGYAAKTGSDSVAGGCLAFFTQATVGGRSRTAVGVVMGQGGRAAIPGRCWRRRATRRRGSSPPPRRGARPAAWRAEHFVRIWKTAYPPATPRCPSWRRDLSQRQRS